MLEEDDEDDEDGDEQGLKRNLELLLPLLAMVVVIFVVHNEARRHMQEEKEAKWEEFRADVDGIVVVADVDVDDDGRERDGGGKQSRCALSQ